MDCGTPRRVPDSRELKYSNETVELRNGKSRYWFRSDVKTDPPWLIPWKGSTTYRGLL
jgi:hypothetical protein